MLGPKKVPRSEETEQLRVGKLKQLRVFILKVRLCESPRPTSARGGQ